ncbi:hypothetical protein FRAAL5726 [Frankia alni ACN14a]|uniref:Uncharacterized protein n=1 Tax=Frankia alni (strain DSM 45986 / CECT 9034 / ACN14a) TaxID=326424 RepID=Q0RDV8_FRAAA|nr:hypothetical protein FRAAL5726 [Frankia alni ACN14a]
MPNCHSSRTVFSEPAVNVAIYDPKVLPSRIDDTWSEPRSSYRPEHGCSRRTRRGRGKPDG